MKVDREGYFRGVARDLGMQESKAPKKSVGVCFVADLSEWWDEDANDGAGGWVPLEGEWEMEAEGTAWIVGKDGDVLNRSIENLCQHMGWSGNADHIFDGTWQPTPCQFVVKAETFRDKTQFKIAYINAFDATPGGGGNVKPERARQLSAQYGAQFRAVAGTATKPAPKSSKPSTPPKSDAKPKDRPPQNSKVDPSDIPF